MKNGLLIQGIIRDCRVGRGVSQKIAGLEEEMDPCINKGFSVLRFIIICVYVKLGSQRGRGVEL